MSRSALSLVGGRDADEEGKHALHLIHQRGRVLGSILRTTTEAAAAAAKVDDDDDDDNDDAYEIDEDMRMFLCM